MPLYLSHEKCVRAQALLCPPDCLWTPPTTQGDLANDRPNLDCHSSFFLVLGYWVCVAPVSWSVAGPEDVPDESSGIDVEDELVPELDDNPGTTRGWPTHRNIRGLRIVYQAIELQACHRLFALSRRAQGLERILVLPRLYALPHWLWSPLWSSWIFEKCPVELKSFLLLMCIDAPESTDVAFDQWPTLRYNRFLRRACP